MNRAQMLLARDRIATLVGQVEAMSWSERTINSRWIYPKLEAIQRDLNDLTWYELVTEPKRDKKGRFKAP